MDELQLIERELTELDRKKAALLERKKLLLATFSSPALPTVDITPLSTQQSCMSVCISCMSVCPMLV